MNEPALLAVAHGSADPRAAVTLRALMARVRRAAPSLHARLALLDHGSEHGMPDVPSALRECLAGGCGAVAVVPLLLTPAYHAQVDLPRLLGTVRDEHPQAEVVQARALGPHPLLTEAALHRLRMAGVPGPDARTAVVLAAAGSSDAGARGAVHALARAWAREGWRDAAAAFASASGPTVDEAVDGLRRDGAASVVVASYLLAPGRLPDRVRERATAAGARVVSEPLGDTDEVARLVLARWSEAVASRRRVPAAAGVSGPV